MNYKAYSIRIYPNKTQEVLFAKTVGCCRLMWNEALSYRNNLYSDKGEYYNNFLAHKDLTEIKKIPEYAFLKEVDSIALQQSINDLEVAHQNFFRKHKLGKKSSVRFKSKHDRQSYRTVSTNNNIRFDFKSNKIKLPKLGWVKFRDRRMVEEKIKSVTISRSKTDKYYASVLVEFNFTPNKPMNIDPSKVFSADMSAKNMMVSEEEEFKNQKFFRRSEKRLKIRQRNVSRKVKGSNNRRKSIGVLASTHENIKNKRTGHQLNMAFDLCSRYDVLCFEDLNIQGMQQFNSGLSKTMTMDFSWSEFTGQVSRMAYKMNKHVVKIGRFDPSSKMCSHCGLLKDDLTLDMRVFKCLCGFEWDRDLNAARNIKAFGLKQLEQQGVNLLKKPTQLTWESHALGNMMPIASAGESTSFRI